MQAKAVAVVVLALGVLLAASTLFYYALVPQPDYADLVPHPEEIIWEEGEQTTLWLSTNRHAVDLRIDSIALGLGDIEERNQGGEQPIILGDGPGCLDVVIHDLTVAHDAGNTWSVMGFIDRGPNTTGDVEVHVRYYRPDTQLPVDGTEIDVTVSAGSDDYSLNLNVGGGGTRRVDVSTNVHYPSAFTRTVVFDTADTSSGGTDSGDEEFHMLENTGLGLVSCGEEEDVLITLHGDEDAELNRYLVDIGPAPTATATPVPTATPAPNPTFSPAYQTLRFCPDSATPPAMQLSGDETVGTVTATGTGTITYSLAPDGESRDFAFFEIDSAGAITVSAAGADDHTGIDGSRLYTFVVRATDDAGRVGEALVAVQVDLSNISTNGDGVCP